MKRKRLDRRVIRTRQLLRDALVSLILEQDYETIKIQNITDKANLGRATFYIHYRDKEELLMTIMDTLSQEHQEMVNKLRDTPFSQNVTGLDIMLDQVKEKPHFYHAILKHPRASAKIRTLLVTSITERLTQATIIPKTSREPVAHFIAGAILGLLHWWIETDMSHSPEEVNLMFLRILQGGLPAWVQEIV